VFIIIIIIIIIIIMGQFKGHTQQIYINIL